MELCLTLGCPEAVRLALQDVCSGESVPGTENGYVLSCIRNWKIDPIVREGETSEMVSDCGTVVVKDRQDDQLLGYTISFETSQRSPELESLVTGKELIPSGGVNIGTYGIGGSIGCASTPADPRFILECFYKLSQCVDGIDHVRVVLVNAQFKVTEIDKEGTITFYRYTAETSTSEAIALGDGPYNDFPADVTAFLALRSAGEYTSGFDFQESITINGQCGFLEVPEQTPPGPVPIVFDTFTSPADCTFRMTGTGFLTNTFDFDSFEIDPSCADKFYNPAGPNNGLNTQTIVTWTDTVIEVQSTEFQTCGNMTGINLFDSTFASLGGESTGPITITCPLPIPPFIDDLMLSGYFGNDDGEASIYTMDSSGTFTQRSHDANAFWQSFETGKNFSAGASSGSNWTVYNLNTGSLVNSQPGSLSTIPSFPTPNSTGSKVAYITNTGNHSRIETSTTSGSPSYTTVDDFPDISITGGPINNIYVAWSPDDTKLAYVLFDVSGNAYIRIKTSAGASVTESPVGAYTNGQSNCQPVWHPDGTRVFALMMDTSFTTFDVVSIDATTGAITVLTTVVNTSDGDIDLDITPDGSTLVYSQYEDQAGNAFLQSVWKISTSGGSPTKISTNIAVGDFEGPGKLTIGDDGLSYAILTGNSTGDPVSGTTKIAVGLIGVGSPTAPTVYTLPSEGGSTQASIGIDWAP